MKASMWLLVYAAMLFSLMTQCISAPRYLPHRRHYRNGPIFTRARAVWHRAPKGLRYRQLGETEVLGPTAPGTRERIWYIKPQAIRRKILRRSPCPRLQESREVMSVVREALTQVNTGSIRLGVKNFGMSEIRVCKKCAGGRCTYDNTKVKTTVTLAPLCGSKDCKCGFETAGPERICSISGTTRYGISVQNATIECAALKRTLDRNTHKIQKIAKTTTINVSTTTTTPIESAESDSPSPPTKAAGSQSTQAPATPGFDVGADFNENSVNLAPAPIRGLTEKKPISVKDLLQ